MKVAQATRLVATALSAYGLLNTSEAWWAWLAQEPGRRTMTLSDRLTGRHLTNEQRPNCMIKLIPLFRLRFVMATLVWLVAPAAWAGPDSAESVEKMALLGLRLDFRVDEDP